MGAYEKSKTLAERAAWDFVAQLAPEEAFELVCLNPVYVLGPSLSGIENASNEIVGKLLRRDMPGVPRLHFGLVDVRDVAAAHVSALTSEQAAGERFLLSAEPMWMKEIASTLDEAGYRVPMTQLPNWLVRLATLFDPILRLVTRHLGRPFQVSSAKARSVLGWQTRPVPETVLETARSIMPTP